MWWVKWRHTFVEVIWTLSYELFIIIYCMKSFIFVITWFMQTFIVCYNLSTVGKLIVMFIEKYLCNIIGLATLCSIAQWAYLGAL